jgi:hypothetical protein
VSVRAAAGARSRRGIVTAGTLITTAPSGGNFVKPHSLCGKTLNMRSWFYGSSYIGTYP